MESTQNFEDEVVDETLLPERFIDTIHGTSDSVGGMILCTSRGIGSGINEIAEFVVQDKMSSSVLS